MFPPDTYNTHSLKNGFLCPTVKIGVGCKGRGTKRDKIIKGQGHWSRGQDARLAAAAAGWVL